VCQTKTEVEPPTVGLSAASRAVIQERLETIERAVLSARSRRVDDLLRHEARREAHKLAGSLDIVGLTEAADIAGALEHLLQTGDEQAGRGRELAARLRGEIDQAFTRVRVGSQEECTTPASPSSSSSARILVADDDDILAMMIESALRRQGYHVVRARDGAEAVALAARQEFDLVLLDLQMPVMDGFEATEIIRRRNGSNVPIVALTARAFKDDEERCRAVGMNDFLTKPIDARALRETLLKWARP
jgi:CheY-like chemotaxis protein